MPSQREAIERLQRLLHIGTDEDRVQIDAIEPVALQTMQTNGPEIDGDRGAQRRTAISNHVNRRAKASSNANPQLITRWTRGQ